MTPVSEPFSQVMPISGFYITFQLLSFMLVSAHFLSSFCRAVFVFLLSSFLFFLSLFCFLFLASVCSWLLFQPQHSVFFLARITNNIDTIFLCAHYFIFNNTSSSHTTTLKGTGRAGMELSTASVKQSFCLTSNLRFGSVSLF